ncbi:hypothetical protein MASR2M48_34390 [Spirochaetota bacterium]
MSQTRSNTTPEAMNRAGHHLERNVLKRIEENPNEKIEKNKPKSTKADDMTIEPVL